MQAWQSQTGIFRWSAGVVLGGLLAVGNVGAAPGTLAEVPLFVKNSARNNIIVGFDDSGSMSSEVLFPTNDGALWYDDGTDSFINITAGETNFEADRKYVYLFPYTEGPGRSNPGTSDKHFVIPPVKQFAFTRSSHYNKAFYDPDIAYEPWPDVGGYTYSDADPAAADYDPNNSGLGQLDLTSPIQDTANNFQVDFHDNMVLPAGTTYYKETSLSFVSGGDAGAKTWYSESSDTVTGDDRIAIKWDPAVYYERTRDGSLSYSIDEGISTEACDTLSPAEYDTFRDNPGDFQSSDVDALGPDGACLIRHEISAGTSEMQNFANWFTYYRKRHLAARNGLAESFQGMNGVRVGWYTINKLNDVTMWPFTSDSNDQRSNFFDKVFQVPDGGGTENRKALNHAGQQYQRTDSDAPITEPCQKNFTLFFTDGFSVTNAPVGNEDGDDDSAYDGEAPYQDSYSGTLADVAMRYYEDNLRSSLDGGEVPIPTGCSVSTPDPWLDCNPNPHMNTYTVGLGAQGRDVYGQSDSGVTWTKVHNAYEAHPDGAYPTWPNANSDRDRTQIDDLYHAAVNGRGEMFNADTPAAIADSLGGALSDISSRTGSAASVTFNSATLGTESAVYLGLFNSNNWSGELLRYPLDPVSGDISNTPTWQAGEKLDNRDLSTASGQRTILTYNSDGVPFRWSDLNAAQKNDLNTGPDGNDDRLGQARLDFLRGDRSNEGTGEGFRVRDSRLGDIVHGGPVYVGQPRLNWKDGEATNKWPGSASGVKDYSTFKFQTSPDGVRDRQAVIYTGSNDGMLHGFRDSDGKEVLAYIPSNLFSTNPKKGLHYLTDPDYKHTYYVDLQPTVSDAYIPTDSPGGTRKWTTVLIGGERGGGRGLFALDVTDPSQFSESNAESLALWEFTNDDDPDLGHTFSKPVIVPVNATYQNANNTDKFRWAAIFGNGYNDKGSGTAQLFIVFLKEGLDGTWTAGSDYYKLDTQAGSTSDRNGLGTPAIIDTDGDGSADRVYAGDLRGNMWAFDISSDKPSKWGPAFKGPKPLFTAKDSSGNRQPITTQPDVTKNPNVVDSTSPSNLPNMLVLFGTGQYLADGDITRTQEQSFYGVWDDGNESEVVRKDLIEQKADVSSDPDNRFPSNNAVDYTGGARGWFMDLPVSGERSVTRPKIRDDIVLFNTTIPSTDPCDYGGSGWEMAVRVVNGGRPSSKDPVTDLNGDGALNESDVKTVSGVDMAAGGEKFTQGMPTAPSTLGENRYTPGSETQSGQDIEKDKLPPVLTEKTGRMSWQELLN